MVAILLVNAGDHTKAAAEAEAALAVAMNPTADTLDSAACTHALASAAIRDDAALAGRYAARAVALLRQSFARGYADVAHMLKDSDLDPLRRRPDYAALLWDLADADRSTPP